MKRILINLSIRTNQLSLGGTSLGDLLNISEDVFEDAGQSEPLTSRL